MDATGADKTLLNQQLDLSFILYLLFLVGMPVSSKSLSHNIKHIILVGEGEQSQQG